MPLDRAGRRPGIAVTPRADDTAPWEAEGSLRELFDRLPVGVYHTTATGQFLDANLTIAKLLGYANRDAFLQVNAADLYAYPEDRARWMALMVQGGLVHNFEVRLRRRDGNLIWVRDTARAVHDGEGRIRFYQGTVEDITERKTAEEAGRKGEALFHLLFEEAPIGMVLIATDHRLLKTNRAFRALLGYSAEELRQKRFTDITHPDDVEQDVRSIAARLSGGPPEYKTKKRYLKKNGDTVWVHLTAKLIRDEAGQIQYGLGMVENITECQRAEVALEQANEALYRINAELEERVAQRTRELQDEVYERRRTEIALRLSEERLQAIVDNTSAIVTLKDLEGRYLFANRQFASTVARLPRDQLIGKRFQDVLPPSTAVNAEDNDREVLAAGVPREFEEEVPLADGHHTFLVIRFPLLGSDGVPYAIGTVATDITHRKRAEEAIAEARKEADRANQAKSEFLSRMSHELRTPLNAVLGFSQLLEMDALSPMQQESVGHIAKAGRHLLDLINEILDLARIEAGRMQLSPEPIGLRDAVGEALELIRPVAAEWKVQIDGGVADDHYVIADRQRLKQVLLNLLSNAVKYNRIEGRVSVECALTSVDRVRISITDTGAGLSPEQLQRLFVPFERLQADDTGVQGTGLGLVHSLRLMEAMGGTIGVDSEVGRGSTFWVELARAEPPAADEPAPIPPTASSEAAPSGSAHTILYLEDNLANFRLVQWILSRRPHIKLISAMQGRLGLDLARKHRPDLVLLDLHLPGIPGTEVLARLQADPKTSAIPVVIISADASKGQSERLLSAGARAYLTKPFDVEQFLRTVDELLAATETGS